MRLEPLYRTVFRYPDGGRGTVLEGEAGSEGHYFFVAEGAVGVPEHRSVQRFEPHGGTLPAGADESAAAGPS